MRKPKIVPAKVWRLPQSHFPNAPPDLPGARPAPDYYLVVRDVEKAMRSLSPSFWIDDPSIESHAEKFAKLLYRQIGAAEPMTARQARAHLAEIRKCAEALAEALKRAGPDIEAQLDGFRATSLDKFAIKTPSVGNMKIAIQWIAEAAALAEPPPGKGKGPQRKDFAREVERLAAEEVLSTNRAEADRVGREKVSRISQGNISCGRNSHASAKRIATERVMYE